MTQSSQTKIAVETNIINRLRQRIPCNSEVAQLQLLKYWELFDDHHDYIPDNFPIPLAEEIVTSAYGFSEQNAPEYTRKALDMLTNNPAYDLDKHLLTYRANPLSYNQDTKEKILIATNLGNLPTDDANQRQSICADWLETLRAEDKNIELLNVTYSDEPSIRNNWHSDILLRSARDVVNNRCPKIPIVLDIFNSAAKVAEKNNIHYFGFINSDIFITHECLFTIRQLIQAGYNTMGFTRTDIPSVTSINNPSEWIGLHISGTDLFVCNTQWWKQHVQKFAEYILGTYWWDCVYVGAMMLHSNFYYASQQRGAIFHIKHDTLCSSASDQAHYNLLLRESRDSFFFEIQNRYCDRLASYTQRHRCLPSIKTNKDLLNDKFILELKSHLTSIAS